MFIAFVLMNVKLGMEREMLEQLKKFSSVKEAHVIYGTFDIIVKLENEDMDCIRDFVSSVRGLNMATTTLTMIVREKAASEKVSEPQ